MPGHNVAKAEHAPASMTWPIGQLPQGSNARLPGRGITSWEEDPITTAAL